ncbi:MAG: DUF3667 domain-containing protein [Cytophagaceae bacterium]|nr:DUF3667 domain-containing protein [Cytophagaceae bacterium]
MEELTDCKNCGTKFSGNYCPSCGQKKFSREDFSFKRYFREIAEDVFDYDSKIFRTIKYLILRPGFLTVEFLNGRQKSYIGPVKLYLIIIAVNFIIYSTFDAYSPVNVEYLKGWGSKEIRELIDNNPQGSIHDLNIKINDTLPVVLYFLIFIYAGFLKLYFFNTDKYYTEHLIFCLHFMSFGFLRDTLFLPIHYYNQDAGAFLAVLTTVIYFFYSLKIVYHNTGMRRIINTIVLYGFFFFLFSFSIMFSVLINLLDVSDLFGRVFSGT